MNENAKKWVKALRSGEYQQTIGELQGCDGFCCLGVGVMVYAKETGTDLSEAVDGTGKLVGGNLCSFSIYDDTRQWLGLADSEGEFYYQDQGDRLGSLVRLNDDNRLDFNQIADVIESEPRGLFADE